MKIEILMTITDDSGKKSLRCLSNPNAKHKYDISQTIEDMKNLEDYWIKEIDNTMAIHKKS